MENVRFSISSPLNIRYWSFDNYNSCSLSPFSGFNTESGDFRCGGSGPSATLEDIADGRFPVSDHYFGSDNTAQFQSVKKIIVEIAAQMLNEPKPRPPEHFPSETYVIYGYDYVRPKRELISNPALANDDPISRKLALVDELPQGPLMRLARDMLVRSYVVGKRGNNPPTETQPIVMDRHMLFDKQLSNSLDDNLAAYMACNGLKRLYDAIGEPFANGSREVTVVDTAPWHHYYPIDV